MFSNLLLLTSIVCLNLTWTTNGEGISSEYFNSLNLFSERTKLLLEERLNEITVKVVNSTESKHRFKRAILNPARNKKDSYVLKDVEIGPRITAPVVIAGVAYIKTSWKIYLVGAGKINFDGSRGSVMSPVWIWDDETNEYQLLNSIETPGAIGVEGFVINDEAYFIFAINTDDKLLDYKKWNSKLYKIDLKQNIVPIQSFGTTGATKWKSFKSNGFTFLVHASVVRWKRLDKLHEEYSKLIVPKTSSEVKLYKWTGVAFTKIANLQASQTTSVDVATFMRRSFLAVVNQTFGEISVESTVLIYEIATSSTDDDGEIKLIQKITGWSVADVHFIIEQNHLYLAIAYNFRVQHKQLIRQLDSVILRFNGLFFLKYQNIQTDCALQWTTLGGSHGEQVLHLQSSEAQDRIFQLVDETWTTLPVHLLTDLLPHNHNQRLGLGNLIKGDESIVAVGISGNVQFVYLNFFTHNPHALRSLAVEKCRELLVRLNNFVRRREEYERSNRRIASLTQYQQINGVKHFKTVDINKLHLKKMVIRDTNIYLHVINNRMEKMKKKFERLPNDLENYLKKTQHQVITGNVIVNNIRVDNLNTKTIEFNRVNNRPFCKFLSNIIQFPLLQQPNQEERHLHFDHIVYRDDITLHGTLNTLSIPAGVVFLDKHNFFKFPKTFRHRISINNNLKIKQTINRIRPEHILLIRDHQVIKSETHIYGDIIANSIDLIGEVKIANIPWSWFTNETVQIDRPMMISGKTTITNDMLVLGDIHPNGLVSGVDVETMFIDSILLNKPVTFYNTVNFHYVTFENLFINGKLNEVSVPNDLVLIDKSPWNVNLVLNQPLHLINIDVSGFINGIKVDRNHIMTKSGDQQVTGTKSFVNIHMDSHLRIDGLVNDYHLKGIIKKIKSDLVVANSFYHKLTVQNLNVNGKLPSDLKRLLYDTLKTNKDHEFVDQHVTFIKTTVFQQNLDLPHVIIEHLIPIRSDKSILLPTKVLNHVVFEDNIIIKGKVNTIDVNKFLKNVLLITGNQTIRGAKTFKNLIHVERDSNVIGKINNIELDDVIKINQDANIKNKITFDEILISYGKNVFETTKIHDRLNGEAVDVWFEDTLLTTSTQIITGSKTFYGVVNIGQDDTEFKDLNVVGDVFINNVNLNEFVDDVVLINETNIINSRTIIDASVTIAQLETKIVDSVNIIDLFDTALHVDEERCLQIDSDVNIQKLHTKRINNINMTLFFQNVVYANDDILPRNLHFHQVIANEIKLIGLVDGVKFKDDAVTIDRSMQIDIIGRKVFQRINIDKLDVRGNVNEIDLVHLNNTVMKQDINQKITGVLMVENLHVRNNISVKGFVAGYNLSQVMTESWFIDEDIIINQTIEFHDILYNPTTSHDFQVNGLLDEVNIVEFYENLLTIDREQEISGHLTFKDKVIVNNIKIGENIDLIKSSYINGINLPEWDSKILKRNKQAIILEPQTFENVVIFDTLEIKGKMNDIYFDDILKLNTKNQNIENVKQFNEIIVKTLEIEGTIMGVNVEHWMENALFIDENEALIFKDEAQFESLIFEEDVIFEGSLNEIDLSSVITTHGQQDIIGLKIFTNVIYTPRWMHSLNLFGTVNLIADLTFPNLVNRLLTVPLNYPCERDYVYHMYGCYRIYSRLSEKCDYGAQRLEYFSESEKQMLRTMRLEERNFVWFIPENNIKVSVCRRKANLTVTEDLMLTGKFTFTNQTILLSGSNRSIFVTSLQRKFEKMERNYNLVKYEMNVATRELETIQNRMCLKLLSFENDIQNAYRPLGPFDIVQIINVGIKRYVSLDLAMTRNVMSFLAITDEQISLYQQIYGQFVHIQTIDFPNPKKWLKKPELQNYQDKKAQTITVFLPYSEGCHHGFANSIEVITLKLTSSRAVLKLRKITPVQFHCTSVRNIQSLVIRDDIYIISGVRKEIFIWKMSKSNLENKIVGKKTEQYDIYSISTIDSNGMFAVATQFNGISLITIYSFNFTQQRLTIEFIIQDFPKIRQITSVANHSPYFITFLATTQVMLIEYFPTTHDFNIKQTLNLPCPRELFWVTSRDQTWLIINSCGCNAYFYSLTDYLTRLYEVQEAFVATPVVFEHDREIFLIAQLKYSCFLNTEKIVILRGQRKGPSLKNECHLTCTEAP